MSVKWEDDVPRKNDDVEDKLRPEQVSNLLDCVEISRNRYLVLQDRHRVGARHSRSSPPRCTRTQVETRSKTVHMLKNVVPEEFQKRANVGETEIEQIEAG